MITGTVKNAVKLQMLDTKWQEKKADLNAGKAEKDLSPEERNIAQFQEQMEKERESNSHADTYNKLKSGGKLTEEEIEYLQKHDPEALAKYREAQAEKKAYENELKNCKTKDEVQRVKMNRMGNFAAEAKSISTDPYIPLDKKVELMNQLNNKVCLIGKAHNEFVKSRQYDEMPTEAELEQERNEESSERLEAMQDVVSDSVDETEEDYSIEEESIDAAINSDVMFEEKNIAGQESAEDRMQRARNKKDSKAEFESQDKEDISFEKISDDIRKFVISMGSSESNIDIGI